MKLQDIPHGMEIYDQPITVNGKLYFRGVSRGKQTVFEYVPTLDQWDSLPYPEVDCFTLATLKGKLTIIGGMDKASGERRSTIYSFDVSTYQWIPYSQGLPSALAYLSAIEYQHYLIIAGGQNSKCLWVSDTCVLDTDQSRIFVAEPLPKTGNFDTLLIGDDLFLVAQNGNTLRANAPTLISLATQGKHASQVAWQSLPQAPDWSSPVSIGDRLVIVGGKSSDTPLAAIQVYDSSRGQWMVIGELPEPMADCCCVVSSQKLFVLGCAAKKSAYVAELT